MAEAIYNNFGPRKKASGFKSTQEKAANMAKGAMASQPATSQWNYPDPRKIVNGFGHMFDDLFGSGKNGQEIMPTQQNAVGLGLKQPGALSDGRSLYENTVRRPDGLDRDASGNLIISGVSGGSPVDPLSRLGAGSVSPAMQSESSAELPKASQSPLQVQVPSAEPAAPDRS